MAQFRHYYTLRWTSCFGVNCRGREAVPDPHSVSHGLLWSLGYSYPWPILHSPCAPLFHQHTNDRGMHTLTHLSPLCSLHPAGRNMASWVTSVPAAVQRGTMWGTHPGKHLEGAEWASSGSWRVVCGHLSSVSFFYSSPLEAVHEGSHLPTASHSQLQESVCHFALWACLSSATSSHTFRIKPCWDLSLIIFDFFSILSLPHFDLKCHKALELRYSP